MSPTSFPPIHIAGAGPVGSLLACLLGRAGREVTVWEKRTALPYCSMAIGITPPSLDLIDDLGLGDRFRHEGVLIHRARVFEDGTECGRLDFRPSENAILSLPQAGTLRILREHLQTFPTVTFRFGEAFPGMPQMDPSSWIIACDGAKSQLRDTAGIPLRTHAYGVRFVMGDFPDHENLGPDARLYFSPRGAVESFPLPDRHRRWIVQLAAGDTPTVDHIHARVRDAARIDLSDRTHSALWPFTPRWGLSDSYVKENLLLCGDAAHQMSPIGGQGMNTGFADAALLAQVLQHPTAETLAAYTHQRQRAFRAAARRAALGMWLGTRTGPAWSRVRRTLIRTALHTRPAHNTLARSFAMRNLPCSNPL